MFPRSECALSRLIPFATKSQQLSSGRVSPADNKRQYPVSTLSKHHRTHTTVRPSESESDNTEYEEGEEVIQYLPVRTRKRTRGKHQQSVKKGDDRNTKPNRRRRRPSATAHNSTVVHKANVSHTSSGSEADVGVSDGDGINSPTHTSQSRVKQTSSTTNRRQKDKRVKLSALDQP